MWDYLALEASGSDQRNNIIININSNVNIIQPPYNMWSLVPMCGVLDKEEATAYHHSLSEILVQFRSENLN